MKDETGSGTPARPVKAIPKAKEAPSAADSAQQANVLRKRDLVARVAEASGVRKKDARAVIEAALAEIGAALAGGVDLALPPLGNAKVNRRKEKGAGEVLVIRLRRGGREKAGAGADEALAAAGD